MGTYRTEFTAPDGHGYVVCVQDEDCHNPQVIVSDNEGSDVVLPLAVFRTMARIVEATI